MAETLAMVSAAQWAEYTVAQIDGRPARRAELEMVSPGEIRVKLVDTRCQGCGEHDCGGACIVGW